MTRLLPAGRKAWGLSAAALILLWSIRLWTAEKSDAGEPYFREVAADVGLRFHHFSGATGDYYMPESMGAGVALLDYDGDGDLDVFLLQGNLLNPVRRLSDAIIKPPENQKLSNRLFRNDLIPGGRLHFTDVTERAGVGAAGYGLGAAVGDYDNDGRPDLYVTFFDRPNILYHNNGDGTFTDVTRQAGVEVSGWSASAAFVDYDRDGDLDLYVARYADFTVQDNKKCHSPTGLRDYCGPLTYKPLPHKFFRNNRGGRFTDVTAPSGIGGALGTGLGVVCADFDRDGWIDIYVANDRTPNFLWLNQRNGTFCELALEMGTAYSDEGIAQAGMGVDAADFDGSGRDSIFVTNLTGEMNSFYYPEKGIFRDIILATGMGSASLPPTGFGTRFLDFDNDGWLDLFVANGAVMIIDSQRGEKYPYREKSQLFWNLGRDKKFQDVSVEAGPALSVPAVSRGVAAGDIDNDGDIDLVVSNNNGPVWLLRNEAGAKSPSLTVSLEGTKDNRMALGARVGLELDGSQTMWRRVQTDGSYLSAGDPRVHFGLGNGAVPKAVVVHWPTGSKERWNVSGKTGFLKLRQGTGTPMD